MDSAPAVFILTLFFFGLVIAFIVLILNNGLKHLFGDKNSDRFLFYLIPQRLSPSDKRLLHQTFLFYRKMLPGKQKLFDSRVKKFMLEKKFAGREGFVITHEKKLLIAASAIRVTLGLRTYNFPSFHTIIVYPEKFYSGFSKAVVRGETNAAGVIVFSWKDFLFGISDANDNLNLGYHEFGHALFVERFRETLGMAFNNNYDAWNRLVYREQKLKEARIKETFRQYATSNKHEFFAVAVENFFERPERFRNDLPNLYKRMTQLLKQDPLAPVRRYDRKAS